MTDGSEVLNWLAHGEAKAIDGEVSLPRQRKKPRHAGFFLGNAELYNGKNHKVVSMKFLKSIAVVLCALALSGCTLLAIADAAGSAVVYGVKTTVNVLDSITPEIVNKK
jgi:hypothetical protein